MIINWAELQQQAQQATEFSVADDDLSGLEIRDAQNGTGFYYFYDTITNRLITDFVLDERPRVALMCEVTLVRKDNCYSPRIRLWKKDKTKIAKLALELPIPDIPATRVIKASVDTNNGHENFWKLVAYLQSLTTVDVPHNAFRVVDGDAARLADLLSNQDKAVLLQAVHAALGGSLSDQDIAILADRRAEIERFERLLREPDYFANERHRLRKAPEALWQDFFERNTWIFGYGLSFVTHESLDDGKLERSTTGASIFQGGGKRIDAIMRTRAMISSLLFCEVKRHDSPLLEVEQYRKPDVYQASRELTGGTAQLQKTTRKAIRGMASQVQNLTADDGSPTGLDFSTTRPRQVLLIGHLNQFRTERGVNGEMMESFELYRRSLADVEVITFDELFERARYIISG